MFRNNPENEIQVTKEDQQQISQFSKLNQEYHEKVAQLKIRKDIIEQMDDAQTELQIMDDEDPTSIKYGDCFFRSTAENTLVYLESKTDKVKASEQELKQEIDDITKKLKRLKASLYAKFGNQINLEEE